MQIPKHRIHANFDIVEFLIFKPRSYPKKLLWLQLGSEYQPFENWKHLKGLTITANISETMHPSGPHGTVGPHVTTTVNVCLLQATFCGKSVEHLHSGIPEWFPAWNKMGSSKSQIAGRSRDQEEDVSEPLGRNFSQIFLGKSDSREMAFGNADP